MITGKCIDFHYPESPLWLVQHCDFQFHSGYLSIIFGEKSCGKTTLLHLISGHLTPIRGSICFKNRLLLPHDYGIMPQDICVIDDMTLFDNINISFIIANRNPTGKDIHFCEQLLKIFKLDHKKDTLARLLSYQEKKILMFMRAVVRRPPLLLMDEALTGLDRYNQNTIQKILAEFCYAGGIVLCFADDPMPCFEKPHADPSIEHVKIFYQFKNGQLRHAPVKAKDPKRIFA